MDWMAKIFMGGWIPEGYRTQALGMATVVSALLISFVQWGTGDMTLHQLWADISGKWPAFVAGWGLFFLGEKVDR